MINLVGKSFPLISLSSSSYSRFALIMKNILKRGTSFCVIGIALLWFKQIQAGSFIIPHPASPFTVSSGSTTTSSDVAIEGGEPQLLHSEQPLMKKSGDMEENTTMDSNIGKARRLGSGDVQKHTTTDSHNKGPELPNTEGKKVITVTSCVTLPFSCETAFDAFSDLPRQPSWSDYLTSVEYVNGNNDGNNQQPETKWTMSMMKMSYSWNAIHTRLARPNLIEWRSTSGMQNGGRVTFDPIIQSSNDDYHRREEEQQCKMTMTMSLVAPKPVAMLMRGNTSRLERLVREKIIDSTLTGFRDTIVKEDLNGNNGKPSDA